MRVVYLATAPLPYDTPILNELSRRVDLHVVYLRQSHAMSSFVDDFGIPPEFEWSTHRSVSVRLPGLDFWTQVTIGLTGKLERLRPDVVMSKSWNPFILEALAWKTVRRRSFLMWSESTRVSGLLRGRVSQLLRRAVLRSSDRIVTIGSQASAWITEDLGVPADKVTTSCLPSGFADEATTRGLFRRIGRFDAAAPRFLFVGRLVARKQPSRLLAAFTQVRAELPAATLTVVGDGPLRAELEARSSGDGSGVTFAGWAEGDELRRAMREHDVLVLPSEREVWGLVVNEALAHGLYVIATDDVGSAHDLLTTPAVGTRVPVHDTVALATAMTAAVATQRHSDDERRVRSQVIAECSAEQFAADLHEAARAAVRGRRQPGRR
ncbi:glycosyltransferase family 4 protein [Modestobacter marinus]|uniref:glycosyltransferase family 4 protein n=1 Tax=Modestobacter marinus TaxID=477641 RepID=UPI001C94406C|nr:glycosyltransferase family 4 protein [Modestobacter marinus]